MEKLHSKGRPETFNCFLVSSGSSNCWSWHCDRLAATIWLSVRIWYMSCILVRDLDKEQLTGTIQSSVDSAISALAISQVRSGQFIAGFADASIRIFDIRTPGRIVYVARPHASRTEKVAGIVFQPGFDPQKGGGGGGRGPPMDGGAAALPDAATKHPAPAPGIIVLHRGGIRVENCYVFKSRLQEYAQKAGLPTPEYHTLKEGPSHEPIFKSTVLVNGTRYESLPGFFSRKAAEQSAAEVALMKIARSVSATAEGIRAVQETGLCKNLLQEYAQKMNYAIPSYICTKQASGVAPFICTVEIGGIQYIGAAARSKKEAEIKAARTALLAIQGQSEGGANGATKYIVVPGQRPVKEADKKPTETPKELKVKRGGYKKKWNKRKFLRKTDQTVDTEKDGGTMTGHVHDDFPMQAVKLEEPSTNGTMTQPDEDRKVDCEFLSDTTAVQYNGVYTIVKQEPAMQYNGVSTIVKQEPLSGTEGLLHDNKARRVKVEASRDTATIHYKKEVGIVRQEPPDDTAMLGEEDRLVEPEPPRDTSLVQPNDTSILQSCNLACSAEMLYQDAEARSEGQESLGSSVISHPNGDATNVKEPLVNTAIMQPEVRLRTIEQVPPSNAELVAPQEEPI